jgi:hypothetical protein
MLSVYDTRTGERHPMRDGEPYPPLSAEARDLIRAIFRNHRVARQAPAPRRDTGEAGTVTQ